MKKLVLISTLLISSQFAQAGDLTLPGERWLADFSGYVCAAFTAPVGAPTTLNDMNVKFESLTSDTTLDNALLKATFELDGKSCRYNAIILADNVAQTSQLVQSIAYDVNATLGSAYADCRTGKEILDAAFKATKYLYYGHPHNVAFMLPNVGSESVCGPSAKEIGANFIVKGIIQPKK